MRKTELSTGDRVLVDMKDREGQYWCKILGFAGDSEEIELYLQIDDPDSTWPMYAPLSIHMDEIVEHVPAPRDLYEDAIKAVKKAKKAVKALQKSLPDESGERYYLNRTLTMLKRSGLDIGIIKDHTEANK